MGEEPREVGCGPQGLTGQRWALAGALRWGPLGGSGAQDSWDLTSVSSGSVGREAGRPVGDCCSILVRKTVVCTRVVVVEKERRGLILDIF